MSPNSPPPIDEATWRNRFILINLARIGFTIFVLIGLLIWQSDVFVEGGSIIGFPMALIGVVASFGAPRWLARRWRTPPGQ
ncbi:MAG TPA: hypothetical protein VNT77_03845 [Allosphingosinicella sp.]|nr:hypothetical protein [Allosphingosinicella sp.]